MPNYETTTYPINGPSPILCSNGREHHLHVTALWDSGLRPLHGLQKPVRLAPGRKLELGFASAPERTMPRVPVHNFVRIPFNYYGIPNRRTIVVEPPAKITPEDIELLNNAVNNLGVSLSPVRNDNTGIKVNVAPQSLVIEESHGPDEVLRYYVHSSGLILAGLRLLATESVAQHLAEQS